MCQQTNSLILCTCEVADEELEEYWILHRYNKYKDEFALGLPFMPLEGIALLDYNKMLSLLVRLLNENSCFDKEIELQKKDVLLIKIEGFDDSFEFKYNGKNWFKYRNRNSFELINEYDEIKSGKLKADISAFLK